MFSALNLHTVQLGLNYRHKYQYYKLDITKLTVGVYAGFKEEEIFFAGGGECHRAAGIWTSSKANGCPLSWHDGIFFFSGVHGKKIQFFISKETVVQNDKLVDDAKLLLDISRCKVWPRDAATVMSLTHSDFVFYVDFWSPPQLSKALKASPERGIICIPGCKKASWEPVKIQMNPPPPQLTGSGP